MEILIAIAGKLAEYTVEPIGRQVGYLAHYKSNHQKLQTKLEDLSAARDEVQRKVDQFKRGGLRIETTVLNWKARVDAIITEAETFLEDSGHAQTACLHGFCPHLVLRYQLSKKSTKLVEEIDELYGKLEFSGFAYDVLPEEVCLLSTGHYSTFDSRNSIVGSVMDELRNPNTEMILVYGVGGVGKTTLVEEVLRQAIDVNLFDDVVMVRDVKENPDLEKIQKEIAMKLGLSIDENHTLAQRAPILRHRIKDRRTLLVLDDVWEKIDLVAVGIPRLVTSKVVLTSRIRKEFSLDMRTQTDISLDVFNEEEAWTLFEKMVGDVVKDSRIRSIAFEVAKKCGGLPVLIVTVARALKDRNKLHVWKDTLRRLRGFDNKELTERAYSALEWSYDQLEDIELKSLFLLCGIIVVENHIYLVDLLKYALGLGLIKNVNTIEEARDAFDTLVEKLKDSCLLLDSDINMHVRMPDLVCEVAVMIASREQHVLSVEYGGELKEWPDKELFIKCSMMSLKSNNIPMLSEVPMECPRLEMFYLYSKSVTLREIPSNFFSEMEKLKVLGFTKVRLLSLPSSLQFLKNVQTLCLEECLLEDVALVGYLSNLEILSFARSNIKQLPKEIGQLIRLRWLDLSDCAKLEVISPDVISRLERLEDLTMRNIFLKWEAERGGSNASLLELKDLSQLTALEIYIRDANILPPNLFSSKLVRYQIYIGNVWISRFSREKTMAETTLNTLKLKLDPSSELDQGIKILLKRSEDLSLDGTESVNRIIRQLYVEDFQQLIHLHLQNNVEFTHIINRKVVFPNLITLSVSSCDHLRFLFSFSMARSLVELKHLEISTCHSIEEIVSTGEYGEENMDNMFNKLEDLKLRDLPNLVRFCTASYIEFQALKNLEIVKCSNMGAFITCKEIEQWDPEENLDLKSETVVRYCLFNEKVGFPGLERLKINQARKLETIWHIQLSGRDSFCRLRQVEVSECYNLINIFPPSEVIGGSSEEICVIGDPLFPNLEILEVERCSRLKNLESSSVSFGKITTLKVIGCEGLEYLMTYSGAKKFVQLATMEVRSCERIVVIVGSNIVGDDAAPNEITFSRLGQLKLSDLKSLRGFCSSRICIVKFPSLSTLMVELCPIELEISPDGSLLQAGSDIERIYNQLNDKELESLFLLCGITMRGKYISFEDLLRYSMGLGFFGKDFKVEEARDVLHSRIKKLKDFRLLTDSSDNRYVRMLDRAHDIAKQIALRDQHILSLAEDGHLHELKEWTDKYFLEKCTIMSFPSSNNIPRLPEVMHCPALKMFLLQGDLDDGSQKISPRFFETMNNLQVLSLRCMTIPSLPPSFQSLKNLDSLCLDNCILGDVALIGELSNLEILSFSESNIKQLPREVGKLTHLRLLDLSDCSNLEVISPGVFSSLGKLEELRMRNSFNKWEVEGERSNASLSELKHLSQLSALEVHIPNADILPANLFSHKLERFNIIIGDAYMWEKCMTETTLNTLKVKLTTASIEELDEGLIFLVKRSEDLSLYAEGMNNIVHSLNTEDFEQLKHLQLQSNIDFNHIINKKVVFPNLRTLRVHRCDCPGFLFSFSMPESLAELKLLEISTCEIMEESLSSTREYGQEIMDYMFYKREDLKLNELPNITRFCSGSIEKLDTEGWIKLGAYNAAMNRNTNEIEETHSEENLDITSELVNIQYFLFDLKDVFPKLTTLTVHERDRLSFLFTISMAKSLVELKHLEISTCEIIEEIVSSTSEYCQENMENMFPKLEDLKLNKLPNLTRFCSGSYIQLPSLEKLDIQGCTKLGAFISDNIPMSGKNTRIYKEVEEKDSEGNNTLNTVQYFLFDEKVGFPKLERLTIIGLPKLKTIWHTQLAPDSFCRLRDVTVQHCNSLKYIFPGSLIADVFNQQLQKLTVQECEVEEIISQGGGLEDQFVFPNLISLEFKSLFQLKRFYPRMLAFSWPLLKTLVLLHCQKVDIFAAEFSGLQKKHDLRSLDTPTAKLLTPAKQSSILINENSFPKLKDLTLVPMDIWYARPTSAVCCEKAVFTGISNRHPEASLPHLRTLTLHGMDMRLWKKTKPAGQNSPKLEILKVKFCRLNNLELSSLSFQNLTNLKVTFCWRLQYLTTYSVARGLRQLKKLKVDECKSMKQILASEGIGEDDSNCEIVFSQLQHLELSDLISLECFCSRNCTVKVPALETVEVNWCSIKLKVSSGILVVDSNMHLDVQKSHSSKEAFNTAESACSSKKTQKQPVTKSSEEAEHIEFNARELHDDSLTDEPNKHGPLLPGIAKREHAVEGVIQETSINSQNMEHHEVMGLNQKQVVTNTSKNLQETLIERLKEELRAKKADIRRLEEELRAQKADVTEERS